jgi:hypothetical protein
MVGRPWLPANLHSRGRLCHTNPTLGFRQALDKIPHSPPARYCTARGDLPEEALHALVRDTGRQVEDESPDTWLRRGREVRVMDGSTITMPDASENQAVYPQAKLLQDFKCHSYGVSDPRLWN